MSRTQFQLIDVAPAHDVHPDLLVEACCTCQGLRVDTQLDDLPLDLIGRAIAAMPVADFMARVLSTRAGNSESRSLARSA